MCQPSTIFCRVGWVPVCALATFPKKFSLLSRLTLLFSAWCVHIYIYFIIFVEMVRLISAHFRCKMAKQRMPAPQSILPTLCLQMLRTNCLVAVLLAICCQLAYVNCRVVVELCSLSGQKQHQLSWSDQLTSNFDFEAPRVSSVRELTTGALLIRVLRRTACRDRLTTFAIEACKSSATVCMCWV